MSENLPNNPNCELAANLAPDLAQGLPIGIFDSGVGGLTVLSALQKTLPHENFLYIGDNARLPYGTKSPQTIVRYAKQVAAALVKRNIKLLVVACNTASAAALDELRAAYPQMPIVGVIEPGAQAACSASASGNIAVIATASTIKNQAYHRAIQKINPRARITAKACPLFVPMAEEGLVAGPLVEGLIAHYLDELFARGAEKTSAGRTAAPDCLVLGCTHFPLLKNTIIKVIGPDIKIVDSANTTALAVKKLLSISESKPQDLPPAKNGVTRFFTTDDAEHFALMGSLFLGKTLLPSDVEVLDL